MSSLRIGLFALAVAVVVTACKKDGGGGGAASLSDPSKLTETAPATYKAKFVTTQGEFVIEVQRELAPNGADRFYNLVKHGYYDDTAFFRVVAGFMVQFGISGNPTLNSVW